MMDSFKKEQVIIAIILVLSNFLIKGIFLSSNSLGGDEPFSVYHAQMDIASIIKLLSEGNNPPLYEIILNFWIKRFGISEFSVRFPSLIFSSLTVLYLYKLGIKYLNERIALYTSVIFLFSNYHILFAHEARVYSLLGLLSVVSMYYFIAILQSITEDISGSIKSKSSTRNKLAILTIINTILIYSHYFGFFILITQFVFFVSKKRLISNYWRQLLIIIALIGLLYLPNIFVVFKRFIESSSSGTWVKAPGGIHSIYSMLRHFSNAPVVAVFVILVLVSSIVKFFLKIKRNHKNVFIELIVFWFVFVFFFMFGVSYFVPMFTDRYLMPAAIAFILVLGISLDYLIKIRKYRYIIPIMIIILFVLTVKPNITNKRNVKETVDKIIDIKDSNTVVLICPSDFILNFAYYYKKEIFNDYNTDDIYLNIKKSLNEENIYGVNSINEVDFKKWSSIVFLDADASFSNQNNSIKKELDYNYNIINEFHFKDIFTVSEYESKR